MITGGFAIDTAQQRHPPPPPWRVRPLSVMRHADELLTHWRRKQQIHADAQIFSLDFTKFNVKCSDKCNAVKAVTAWGKHLKLHFFVACEKLV